MSGLFTGIGARIDRDVAEMFHRPDPEATPATPPPPPTPPAQVGAVPPPANLAAAIRTVAPSLAEAAALAWAAALAGPMRSSGLVTPRRMAAFLGQVAVESAGFTALTENLNYSAEGLARTFPRCFGDGGELDADNYARKPEAIAGVVYASRMGNGDVSSGDGWAFRGGGLIQITGRATYTALAAALGMQLADCVPFVRTPAGASASACWFWTTQKTGLNGLADTWDIPGITRKVNGGENGLAERQRLSAAALSVLT